MEHDRQPTCSEPDCETIAALIATITLGGQLEPAEQSRLANKLLQCSTCIQRLHDYHSVAQLLCLGLPQGAPSPTLRERILANAKQSKAPPAQRWPARLIWKRAVQFVPVVLAILMLVWNLQLHRQLQAAQPDTYSRTAFYLDLFGDKTIATYELKPTAVETEAEAVLWLSKSSTALCLYADHLPALPANQVYQLWLTHNGTAVSAGTFSTNPAGKAWLIIELPMPLDEIQATSVTIEPYGGSTQPMGPALLNGNL